MNGTAPRELEPQKVVLSGNYDWIPGHLAGQTIFILASGPSVLDDFPDLNFEKLRGKGKIVTICQMWNFCNFADYLVFLDTDVFPTLTINGKHEKDLHKYPQIVTGTSCGMRVSDNVSVLKENRKEISKNIEDGLFTPQSGGAFAVHFAIMSGASKIVLIGFDCGGRSNKTHCYNTKQIKGRDILPDHRGAPVKRYEEMAPHIKRFEKYRDRIVNISKTGALRFFYQTEPLEKFL